MTINIKFFSDTETENFYITNEAPGETVEEWFENVFYELTNYKNLILDNVKKDLCLSCNFFVRALLGMIERELPIAKGVSELPHATYFIRMKRVPDQSVQYVFTYIHINEDVKVIHEDDLKSLAVEKCRNLEIEDILIDGFKGIGNMSILDFIEEVKDQLFTKDIKYVIVEKGKTFQIFKCEEGNVEEVR